ncbi:MAG: M23 family metallopeptidase [Cyclobacteriaceae bacterium]
MNRAILINLILCLLLMGISAGKEIDPVKKTCTETCGDVVAEPKIRPTSNNKNKSRFLKKKRKNSQGYYRCHYGIDILAAKGTKLKNLVAGKVVSVRKSFKPGECKSNSFGNYVVVKSKGGKFIKYAHLDKVSVKENDQLKVGDEIGEAGNTGNACKMSTAEIHVHIEVATDVRFRDSSKSCKNDAKSQCDPETDCCDCSPYRIDPEDFMKTKYDKDGNPN